MIRASPPPKKKSPAPPKKPANHPPKIPTKSSASASDTSPPKRGVSPPKRGVSPPKRGISPPIKRSPILPKRRPPPPHSSSPPKRKSPKHPPPAKKSPHKRSPPKSPPPVSPPKRRKPSSAQKYPPPPSPPPPSPPTGSGGVDLGNAQKVLKMLQPYFDDPQFMMFAINGGLLTLMGKALNSTEKVTFFVPDPDTIKDLPDDSPLINDPAIATAVVNLHVVRGRQVSYTELTQDATGTMPRLYPLSLPLSFSFPPVHDRPARAPSELSLQRGAAANQRALAPFLLIAHPHIIPRSLPLFPLQYMTDQHEPLVKDAASFLFNVVLRPSQGPSRATITMPNAYTDESMQVREGGGMGGLWMAWEGYGWHGRAMDGMGHKRVRTCQGPTFLALLWPTRGPSPCHHRHAHRIHGREHAGARARLAAHPRLGLLRPSINPSSKPSLAILFSIPSPTNPTTNPSHDNPAATTSRSREAEPHRGNSSNPSSVQFRSQHHGATTVPVIFETARRTAGKSPPTMPTGTPPPTPPPTLPPSGSDPNTTVPPPPAQ
ncbi:unnamed protein product [Closterium sp. Naga37s-1]|nr:unnamed protein product [Closterium sp. Naga37s-1]